MWPPGAEEFAAWVAIDWADQKHVWALQKAGSSSRQRGELEASPEAVDAWVSELLLQFPGQRIAVALEQKRGALLCLLSKYSALVLFPVHPATASRMRAALYPSQSKDDPRTRICCWTSCCIIASICGGWMPIPWRRGSCRSWWRTAAS